MTVSTKDQGELLAQLKVDGNIAAQSGPSKDFKKFIAETKVDGIVEEIESALKQRNGGKRPAYSDLIREEEGKVYEYVNYVQEGGGVLGVALVGYTYVLEKMGFRFLKLAGTSAGAINTMMLASVDKKNYQDKRFQYQSEIILQEMLNYDLWKLVDGHWLAKWFISVFINKPFGKKLLKWLFIFSIVVPVLYAVYVLFVQLLPRTALGEAFWNFHYAFNFIASIATVIMLVGIFLFLFFRYKFARSSYGVNPGRNFHAWMSDILNRNNIHTTDELDNAMQSRCCDLSLRKERMEQKISGDNTEIVSPYLTIVASDITTQTKVEFPLMAKDYWADPGAVNPADFVRASMAIPVFFEPFKVNVPQTVQDQSQLQQLKAFAYDKTNAKAKAVSFVDGGILSNFPINVFHNPNIKVARMPTLGVKLEDEAHIKPGQENVKKPKLMSFIGKVFSTIRFYYDRDFLKRNEIYEKCIAHVDVEGINWLNFGMNYETQKDLFIRGAMAARIFFLGGKIWVDGVEKDFEAFDWETFKGNRSRIIQEIKGHPEGKEQ